ncbi:TPA: hypothetical protein ACH3X2_005938 [Trebouxia sp. C0005]|nr:MAG: aldose 1-epimerase [Trebouxia sp. A1-2]
MVERKADHAHVERGELNNDGNRKKIVGGALIAAAAAALALGRHMLKSRCFKEMDAFVLRADNGTEAHIRPLGCCIQRLLVPGADGSIQDVVLGFDDMKSLTASSSPFFGVVVGRCANRIEGASFTLDGQIYKLAANNGKNALHGGTKGFDKHIWAAKSIDHADGDAVQLTRTSPDGEEGYPGTLKVSVTYIMTRQGVLKMLIEATTDKATLVNLAQHAYFNLAGHDSGDVLNHDLHLRGDHYIPTTEDGIPTGQITPVKGTPFDFTEMKRIGKEVDETPAGYDHNWVLHGLGRQAKFSTKAGSVASEIPREAIKVRDPQSGRTMTISTTTPGVQFYSGNFLDGNQIGKGGFAYQKHAGFCLETQGFPNAINQPAFPTVVLRPDEKYRHETHYAFTC